MNETATEHMKYEPTTVFGKAVSESNFSRVCIACGRKWADRIKWVQDTIFIGTVMTSVGHCAVRVCRCGEGKMIAEGRSTNGLKPGPTERPPWLFEYDRRRAAEKREAEEKKDPPKSYILKKRLEDKKQLSRYKISACG